MNAFCTIATPSYLPWVRTLADTLALSGNHETLYVLLIADQIVSYDLPSNVNICHLDLLKEDLPDNIYWYFDNFELSNALKPFVVNWLLDRFDKVIFLDSDIYAVGSFKKIWDLLDYDHLLLTPHHISPPSLKIRYTNEGAVADMGVLNGGFAAWRKSVSSTEILEWMCSRFPIYGFCDRKKGMFVDQKLLPLLFQYFPDSINILRDPCLNIAFWNCHERNVKIENQNYSIDGNQVIFFHMSGYRLNKPNDPCSYLPSHENEEILAVAPWMKFVLETYSSLLKRNENKNTYANPFYQFDGITLNPSLRKILFSHGKLTRGDYNVVKAQLFEQLKKIKRRLKSLLQ